MAMAGGASDFGRYLQACRKAKNISLSSVAQRTRITMACLQQIENEDLQQLPDPVFVKGFLRAYAEMVGADVQEAIDRYETSRQKHLQIAQSQSQTHRGGNFWLRFVLAAVLLAGVIAGTLYLAQRMQIGKTTAPQQPPAETKPKAEAQSLPAPEKVAASPESPGPVSEPAPAAQETSAQDSNATAETTAAAAPPIANAELTLEIKAVEVTWLKIIADGEAPKAFSMQPGAQKILTAKHHFNLLIGNAGGIRLTLDGQPVHIPGKSGQVVTMQLP